MRKKIFTFFLALTASIGMMWAETVVVINKSEFTSSGVTKEGVTLAPSNGSMTSSDILAMDGSFEFSTSLGKFTGITIETDANIMQIYEGAYTSAGWPTGQNLGTSAVWTGESETVFISCMVAGMNTITITCTIEPALATENSITINESSHGSVVASSSSAAAGETITLTATPDDGYQLKSISGVYEVQGPLSETLNSVGGETTVTGTEFQCVGTMDANSRGWRVYNPGTAQTLTVSSLNGATLIEKIELTSTWGNMRENKMLSVSAGTLSFNGTPATTVTINDINATSVTISGSGNNAGKTWCISSVKIYYTGTIENELEISDTENANVKTFTMVDSEVTISAEFEPAPVLVTTHTLQLHVNDALMGSVALQNPSNDIVDNSDGTYTVPEGAEVTLLATPNEGYEFIGWKASSSICDFNECEFVALSTVNNPLTVDMYMTAAFMAEFAAVAPQPQPQIGPKEVLDLGTTGCVGEHYQLTGGGTNIYRTVGGVDNKMITIESLHGEIIDNISLKLYYYNVWTGYSVAASSGDVSSWNYDAYEDLVITNINATSVTLSRVGSGQANGYVMFEKVTINNSDEPQPQPAEDVNITPNVDPENPTVYYSTFFDSSVKYELPAGVEAYVADLSGANLLLTKIAEAGEVIPANVAVILKSTVTPFSLTVSDADAVTFTATNDLQGSDTQIATPANCYVLGGADGVVGFYQYSASHLNPHKAYVIYAPSQNQVPRRMPFVFNQATGVEDINAAVESIKRIENGQLIIIKNGVKYNAQGKIVK